MASQDWFSKNFPTLVALVNLFKRNRGQRRQGQRRRQAAQQTASAASQAAILESQQIVQEQQPVRPGPAAPAHTEEAPVTQTVIGDEPLATPATPPVETAPASPVETTRAQPTIPVEPVGTARPPSVQGAIERPPAHEEPAARPAESREHTVPGSPARGTESASVARLPGLAVELEPNFVVARGQLQSIMADRNSADELRREARQVLEQAEVEWEEAGRLLDVARSACERGVALSLPGSATRLRMINEIQDRRRTQAQLRTGTIDGAWEEADHARHRATAEWDKARTGLETAALQAVRELAEAQHLPTIAESLISSALEDVNRARAINEDLVRLGRESFSLLGASNISEEARPENMLMPEPIAEVPKIKPASPDLVQGAAQYAVGAEVTPSPFVSQPQNSQTTPEPPVIAEVVEPIPAPPARETVEVIPPPPPPEAVEPAPTSVLEALRREVEAAASSAAPPASVISQAESGMGAPGTEPSASILEELERGMAALRPLSASADPSEADVIPPAASQAVSGDATGGGFQTAPQDLTFQPDVDARIPGPVGATGQEPSGALAESYSGRLYLMFPSSLDQNDLENVWEVLDEVAGSGAIVDNQMVSREAGIQFTLELKDKVLSMEQLRKRMPGAGLIALEKDRLKVDWPRRA
jgi:hypothetical protein